MSGKFGKSDEHIQNLKIPNTTPSYSFIMAILVVEFSREGYKNWKDFWLKINCGSNEITKF